MALIERSVFRAYDIRGIIGQQLDEAGFYRIGQAIACRLLDLNRSMIFVGRDGRLTSHVLANALVAGLVDSGIDVIDLGMVATPVMYYATHASVQLGLSVIDSGLMVTGSHNPADYNGIKMVLAGKTLVQDDITLIYDQVQAGSFHQGQGQMTQQDILPDYMRRIVQDIRLKRPLRVVVDCGNGIAGPIVPTVLRQLGCEVIELYCEVDGHFPHHHPDPTVEENLVDLKAMVALHQADIGLAFDGDADRLGVVTDQGAVIWPDRLLMLYAQKILKTTPGATIVFDVKCSSHLSKVVLQAGGRPYMCPTGHSIVKGIMKREKAVLAGEMSGHIFFYDRWFGFDDALYSACRLLEILSQDDKKSSDQFALIPDSVNTPEIKIAIKDEDKFNFIQQFTTQATFPEARCIGIDGIRVEFAQGWGLIRASNTTPCLIARFEADDIETLEKIQRLFKEQLYALDPCLSVPF